MITVDLDRGIFCGLGQLLEYPKPGMASDVHLLAERAARESAAAAIALHAFAAEIAAMLFETQEEAYTRAFDVAPQCIPYLSVYLFGEDSYKRAQLMCGLKEAYTAVEFGFEPELPDHLGVVLRFAPHFTEETWDELVRWCIPGPLKTMIAGLTQSQNPYRAVLAAIQALLAAHFPEEFNP